MTQLSKKDEKKIKKFSEYFGIPEDKVQQFVVKHKKSNKRNGKAWPIDYNWWKKGPKWLQEKKKKYKHLEQILFLISESRFIIEDSKPALKCSKKLLNIEPYKINENGERSEYVLLNAVKTRKFIAHEIGISDNQIKRYIDGLAKCGVIKKFNLGRNGRAFSMHYWREVPIEDKTGGKNRTIWRPKKQPILNNKNRTLLKEFEVAR